MEKNKKHLWQLAAAFVSGAVITALVFVAASGSLFQGAVFKGKTTSKAFNVEIKPDTRNVNYYQGKDGIVTVKVGDYISFKRVVTNPAQLDYAWKWDWQSMNGVLKCAPYPEFDSDTLRCSATQKGESMVKYTAYPAYPTTGTFAIITSNLMTVKVQ